MLYTHTHTRTHMAYKPNGNDVLKIIIHPVENISH